MKPKRPPVDIHADARLMVTDERGAKLTASTTSVHDDHVELYRSHVSRSNQRWRWRRWAANNRVIATSGEGYANRDHASAMARRCNPGCPIVDGKGSWPGQSPRGA